MMSRLEALLATKGRLLADGATGSNLFDMGLQTGDSPELWNLDHPDRIAAHYQSFIDAGSDIILTNTFGGNRYRLKLHAATDQLELINCRGAEIARQLADKSEREILVGGSMGPSGEIMEPLGPLSMADAIEAFAEQALALKAGGVDIIWVETMSSREEVEAALKGAAISKLPVVVTLSIDTNGRTMMGVTPAEIAGFIADIEPAPYAVGINCGVGAAETVAAVCNLANADHLAGRESIIVAKANCGVPEYQDGKIVYNGTPEIMAEYACLAADSGARIIGGCCGTTPGHISVMRDVLDRYQPGERPALEQIEQTLGEVSSGAKAQLRGEMSVSAGAVRQREPRKARRRAR